jgi:DnaJ-class molecular chaperone
MKNEEEEEDQGFMSYKEICSLCNGNGYITIPVKENDEVKQCWLCESKGEKEYSQAQVDDFIYKTYYKK